MVTLVGGDDFSTILNFIKSRKKLYKVACIYEIVTPFSKESLADIFYSISIFGNKKLVILNPKNASELDFSELLYKEISANKDFEILVNLSKINKRTNIYKFLKGLGNYHEFSLKKDYTNFDISDAFFISRDKGQVIRLLEKYKGSEDELIRLISIFYLGLRGFLSLKYKNETAKTLHPFVKRKTFGFKITEDEAKALYKRLFELDTNLKSMNVSKIGLMQDFVLNS